MRVNVLRQFPYALDGLNLRVLAEGKTATIKGEHFVGLRDAGFVGKATDEDGDNGNGGQIVMSDLDRRMIDAMDQRLMKASDLELKEIIARRGSPWSGNLVHAEMVAAAKEQMVREAEGAEPIMTVDPLSGVTEQPLAAPGAPTPPSAAAAVAAATAAKESGEKEAKAAAAAKTAENKAVDQFGDPLVERQANTEDLDGMSRAELDELAGRRGVDISAAKNKADVIAALRAAA